MSFFGGFAKMLKDKFFKKFDKLKQSFKKTKKQENIEKSINTKKLVSSVSPQYFSDDFLRTLFQYQYQEQIDEAYHQYGSSFENTEDWLDAVYYWNFGEIRKHL